MQVMPCINCNAIKVMLVMQCINACINALIQVKLCINAGNALIVCKQN